MSYSSEQSKSRMLSCAQEEFLTCGYEKANLRRIAEKAHVTTGALYNHFSGKDALFDALVADVAREMFDQYRRQHEQASQAMAQGNYAGWEGAAVHGSHWIIDFIYQHFAEVRLLLCCSEGTKWTGFLEPFIELEERAYQDYFRTLAPGKPLPSAFFFHCCAASGFQFVAHIVEHELTREEAVRVMDEEEQYRLAGWRALMGL